MKWPLIFLLSIFGLGMGFGTIYFIPVTIEPFYWSIAFIICAFIIARYCSEKYFLTGLAVSIVNAVWMTIMHLSFYTTYAATHTTEMEMMERFIMPDAPQLMMFFIGIISGAVSGLILGILSLIAANLLHNNRQKENILSI